MDSKSITNQKLYRNEHIQRAAIAVTLAELRFPLAGDDDAFGDACGDAIVECCSALGVADSNTKRCDTITEAVHTLSAQMTASLRKQRLLNKPLLAA